MKASLSKTRLVTSKANSPVLKTGRNAALRKRLLRASENEILASRERILMAARTCFAKQGFAGTSIKDILNESGFSRGNFYHHFKSKEEIVQIIITQNLGRFYEHIEKLLTELKERDLSISELIHELARQAELITKGPGKGMAFHVWSLAMVDTEVRATMVHYFEKIREAFEKKLSLLICEGKIPETASVQQLSVTFFGLVIPGFTLQSVFMDDKAISAETYTNSLNLLFKNND